LLDAWRGLAALAVVVHHVAHFYIGGPAVMLFFVISGYCIAASADSCQRKGLGFGRFMLRRLKRIYPPYLLSLAFWGITRALKAAMMPGSTDLDRTPIEWIQNITLTQWVSLLWSPESSAAMNPRLFVSAYWSLCYEEQFYLLTGLMLAITAAIGVSIRTMISVLVVAGLAWNVAFPEISYGLFLEYWALFGLGALVFYRLCRSPEARMRRLIDLSLLAVLAGATAMRFWGGGEGGWLVDAPGITPEKRAETRLVWEELMIGAGFALLLIATRPFNDRIRSTLIYKPFAALGQITFSLYLIHQFNLTFVRMATERMLGPLGLMHTGADGARVPTYEWLFYLVQFAGHIGLATVFWYFCERPFLNRSLLPPSPPKGAPVAASGHAPGTPSADSAKS
jgi:peptidoglycan/LPS O-acetylase OafA/YrhL